MNFPHWVKSVFGMKVEHCPDSGQSPGKNVVQESVGHSVDGEQPWGEEAVRDYIESFAVRYPKGFPIDKDKSITLQMIDAFRGLPFEHEDEVFDALQHRGIGLLGAARLESGEPLILPFNLFRQLTGPIVLSKEGFAARREGLGQDEFCFTTDTETWENLAGRAGTATVQDGRIGSLIVTVLS